MKLRFLVPPLAILSLMAVPAMAQGYYAYSYDGPAITGAQMSDLPSERSNVTMSGSFLRPEVGGTDIYVYGNRHPYRAYRERRDRYDYDNDYDGR